MAQRKTHTAQVKAKVAIEAIKDRKSTAQIASQFEVHPAQVSQWKKQALEVLAESFKGKALKKVRPEDGFTQDQLYAQIGQLKVELDWLKKKSALLE